MPKALRTAMLAATMATLSLAGCANDATPAATPAVSAPTSAFTVKDPWVKAAKAGTMTAAFGTLVNNTGADVTVVSASSPASPMELHEMAMKDGAMVMRPKEGGFVITAHGTHELSPGGDHLMLMKPVAEIAAGDEVTFTLALADGGTVPFTAVAKPFAGAGESYAPTMPMSSGTATGGASVAPMPGMASANP
jgi:copper(I)-binding protein